MKEQFTLSPIGKKIQQPPTDFVKHLKANHFELAHDHGVGTAATDSRAHYKTLHQNYFIHPPADNPDAVSPKFAKERKLELSKANFQIGSPTLRSENPPLITAQKTFFNHPKA
jgi:hypothetical protein